MKSALLLAAVMASNTAIADQHLQFTQKSQHAIKEFASSLKKALKTEMSAGGPLEAINVCNQQAPLIADSLSRKYNMTIARTSLKVRNQNNQADEWEKKVLKQFEHLKQTGDPIESLVFSEAISGNSGMEMRMIKAIPTGQVCLTCHGDNIAEEVQAKITMLYPEDQATGFQLGDIRGAFTVKQKTR
jgi:hypothetical protein